MTTAPLLSIGMIFKNEERCIERCLKSLEPLRQAIPCELIMADTGAEDGSRAIAARYADEVFDFEWINDFAAARNAVMDRCTGKWYLTIDCDEWLDEDISELLAFLKGKKEPYYGFVVQRNYFSSELEKGEIFNDFHALRLARMDTGARYSGMIHESWPYQEPVERLTHTILHHDGYMLEDPKERKNKGQRNMELLRKTLKAEPENLRTLMQCIESGAEDVDLIQYVRRAVKAVKARRACWEMYGGAIMRHAAEIARVREMPELEEWVAYAEKNFPDSIFTRIDVNHTAFLAAYKKEDWQKAIQYGEAYRKGMRLLHAPKHSKKIDEDLGRGCLRNGHAASERMLLLGLIRAYHQVGQSQKALELLVSLNGEKLDAAQLRNSVVAFCQLHAESQLDIAPALAEFYGQISRETPDKAKQTVRLAVFNGVAVHAFTKEYRREEQTHRGYLRPAYTAFAALAGQCEAGRGAAIMQSFDPAEMRTWLQKVEDWQALPIEALEYALTAGVVFPLAEKPLNMEVLDGLAAKLTHGDNTARKMALALPKGAEFDGPQNLYWAQAFTMAALRSFDWAHGKNSAPASRFFCPPKSKKEDRPSEKPEDTPETGLALIRAFVCVEAAMLPFLYTPQLFWEETAALLPPMHRWGLYCTKALDALDSGNPQEYLSILRRGLKACPGEKDMVQFLLDRFLEDARPKADPELLALAEKVRTILAAYDPDSPAVTAIRESPAYKQVAWIIESEPITQMVQ